MAPPKKTDKPNFLTDLQKEMKEDQNEGRHYGARAGQEVVENVEVISTGSLLFDYELDGGYRCGWSRFTGKPESGKTSQGLSWGKSWQDFFGKDAFVACFNAEGRITPDLIRRSGIDTDPERFMVVDAHNGDYVVNKMGKWIHHNTHGKRYYFLVDSSDALIRTFDLDKGAEDAEKVGGSASLQSFAGKRLSLPIARLGHHLYMTSQIRQKLNAPAGASGGEAPKFYSSLTGKMGVCYAEGKSYMYFLQKPEDKKSRRIGHLLEVDLQKTQNEATGVKVLIPIRYKHNGGIWKEREAVMICQEWGWVEKNGTWFGSTEKFADELIKAKILSEPFKYQGENKLVEFFESEPKLVSYIAEKFSEIIKIKAAA